MKRKSKGNCQRGLRNTKSAWNESKKEFKWKSSLEMTGLILGTLKENEKAFLSVKVIFMFKCDGVSEKI